MTDAGIVMLRGWQDDEDVSLAIITSLTPSDGSFRQYAVAANRLAEDGTITAELRDEIIKIERQGGNQA